jgi:hypothetical protein
MTRPSATAAAIESSMVANSVAVCGESQWLGGEVFPPSNMVQTELCLVRSGHGDGNKCLAATMCVMLLRSAGITGIAATKSSHRQRGSSVQ